ncbi:BglG family transcription antiterminator [Anaerosinus massiliensis]|uniref:BglG family transcription antiterminator n=1 Tax=Massilibacillus massiliensis TaxID=1806837 RepID=UPI000B2850BC|nr:BglG family transcription antiterminator [Massilibacillus massiliensis]
MNYAMNGMIAKLKLSQRGDDMNTPNERILKIFKLLMKHDAGITGEELSKLVGVSSRTIRSDMKSLHSYLKDKGAAVHSTSRAGYSLIVTNQESFKEMGFIDQAVNRVNLTSNEARVFYIIKKLLFNALQNKQITQMDLADEMFISISTLKLSLKEVEKKIAKYALRVIRYKSKGIQISGNEAQLRYCISEYIFNREQQAFIYTNQFYREFFKEIALDKIQEIILAVTAAKSMKLTDISIKNLLIHTAIAIKRAKYENQIVYTISQAKKIEKTIEFQVAKGIIEEIYKQLNIDIAMSEIYYIAQHLIASKKYLDVSSEEPTDHIEDMLKQILFKIDEVVKIDFSSDQNLIKGLMLHLKAALTRMKFQMNIRNEVLEVIKSEYPLAFQIAVIASSVIEKMETIHVDENEIGYIAIHFGAALSRKGIKDEANLKKAIIVCATGIGTAILIKTKIEEHFKNQIQVVKTIAGYELDEIAVNDIDIILTTIPIEHIQSEKIMRVTNLLNKNELDSIENYLFRAGIHEEIAYEKFFSEDCFYKNMPFKNKQEVLDFMTNEMIKRKYMSEQTKLSVFEREGASSTEIGNLVAIPHPMYNDMDLSSIAILILDKPILWDEQPVQVVFLINIAKDNAALWETVFLKLFEYLVKENGVKALIREKSYQKFMKSFRRRWTL